MCVFRHEDDEHADGGAAEEDGAGDGLVVFVLDGGGERDEANFFGAEAGDGFDLQGLQAVGAGVEGVALLLLEGEVVLESG